eukprot:jgi/Orpsp1_1/1185317/evm.model.c7180000093229.1
MNKYCSDEEINEILQSQSEINIYDDENENEYILTLECKLLNDFLNKSYNINCCKLEGVICDDEGIIKKLQLEINSFNIGIFPKSIFELPELVELTIINTEIKKIPDDINEFNYIQKIKITKSNLKELPINLYKFYYLNILVLENNSELNAKIINFENSPLENCFLRGTPISCYQPGTCLKIDTDKNINSYNNCSNEIIPEVKNDSNKEKIYEKAGIIDVKNLPDCAKLNTFLLQKRDINCCHVQGVTCDINNNIVELNLNNKILDLSVKLNFNEFPNLDNLKILYIWHANIINIPEKIDYSSGIQKIDLYNNNIEKFPYHLSNLKNLSYLSLGNNNLNNNLNEIPINDLSKFISLDYFIAFNNKFNSLNISGSFSYLERFYIDNNSFDNNIFNGLSLYKNLQWIYLMNNQQIEKIPNSISNLTDLEIIDIRDTSIQELPDNIYNLSKMKRLYIENNTAQYKIMNFVNSPIDFCYFGNKTLIIYYQKDTCKNIKNRDYFNYDDESDEIKEYIDDTNNENKNTKDCENLKGFLKNISPHINCCDLENISCDKDDNIEKINLIFNEENKIDFNEFPILENLNELEINSANIPVLPSKLFDLPKLQILNINKSKISEITNEINPESPIRYMDLSNNYIKTFPYQFEILSNLKSLNLMNNNITEELNNDLMIFSLLEN